MRVVNTDPLSRELERIRKRREFISAEEDARPKSTIALRHYKVNTMARCCSALCAALPVDANPVDVSLCEQLNMQPSGSHIEFMVHTEETAVSVDQMECGAWTCWAPAA